jgi:hypothetical protein
MPLSSAREVLFAISTEYYHSGDHLTHTPLRSAPRSTASCKALTVLYGGKSRCKPDLHTFEGGLLLAVSVPKQHHPKARD